MHIHLTEGHSDRTHRKTSRSQDERPSNHKTCLCSSQKYLPKSRSPAAINTRLLFHGGRLMASLTLPHQSAHTRYASLQNILLCSSVFLSQACSRFSSSSHSMSEINWCCWSNYLLSGSASSVLQQSESGRGGSGIQLIFQGEESPYETSWSRGREELPGLEIWRHG